LVKRITCIKKERDRLAKRLKLLSIVEKVFPSDSNFLLVKTINADMIYSDLIKNKIIVRNRSRIVPGCIRITIGTVNENNRLLNALRKIEL
jgi:histidinol-phosphate aminotransferase